MEAPTFRENVYRRVTVFLDDTYQISLNWGIDGHLSGITPFPATSLEI